MTVDEFKAVIASIPAELGERLILLPEGTHGSDNARWKVDDFDTTDTEPAVIVECD